MFAAFATKVAVKVIPKLIANPVLAVEMAPVIAVAGVAIPLARDALPVHGEGGFVDSGHVHLKSLNGGIHTQLGAFCLNVPGGFQLFLAATHAYIGCVSENLHDLFGVHIHASFFAMVSHFVEICKVDLQIYLCYN